MVMVLSRVIYLIKYMNNVDSSIGWPVVFLSFVIAHILYDYGSSMEMF